MPPKKNAKIKKCQELLEKEIENTIDPKFYKYKPGDYDHINMCFKCGKPQARDLEKYFQQIPYSIDSDQKFNTFEEKAKQYILSKIKNPIVEKPDCSPTIQNSVPKNFKLLFSNKNKSKKNKPPLYLFKLHNQNKSKKKCNKDIKKGGKKNKKKTRKKKGGFLNSFFVRNSDNNGIDLVIANKPKRKSMYGEPHWLRKFLVDPRYNDDLDEINRIPDGLSFSFPFFSLRGGRRKKKTRKKRNRKKKKKYKKKKRMTKKRGGFLDEERKKAERIITEYIQQHENTLTTTQKQQLNRLKEFVLDNDIIPYTTDQIIKRHLSNPHENPLTERAVNEVIDAINSIKNAVRPEAYRPPIYNQTPQPPQGPTPQLGNNSPFRIRGGSKWQHKNPNSGMPDIEIIQKSSTNNNIVYFKPDMKVKALQHLTGKIDIDDLKEFWNPLT